MVVTDGLARSWIAIPGSRAALAALPALLAACGHPDPTAPLPLYTVSAVGGAQLAAPAGSELPDLLQVEVRDPAGLPAKGVAVRFQVVTGRGAALADTLVATDAGGIGTTRLRLGTSRDSVVVSGAVRGQEDRGVTFRVIAMAPAELQALQPSVAASGDTVQVRGTGFADPRGTDVYFGLARARIVGAVADTLVSVVVPPCLTTTRVPVTVRAGTAVTNAVSLTVAATSAPLTLAPFEGATVRGTDSGCLRLSGGQRVLIVPQLATYADSVPSGRGYTLAAEVPNLPLVAPEPRGRANDRAPAPDSPADARSRFEAMLRAEERAIAAERMAASEPPVAPAGRRPRLSRAAVPAPALGSTRTFHVLSRLDGTAFALVNSRLRFAGTNILVYEDVASPAPLADAAMTALGDLFDRTLYTVDVNAFGAESDLDENGRVIVLMTPVVNGLTPTQECTNSGFVPGFFFGGDLDTRNRNSNRGELFYALVPDPNAQRGCAHLLQEVLGLLPPTFAHEFQHMISFNQHVLVRRAASEATWLNEGLSHMAEELAARDFDARYPSPAGRSFPGALLPDSAVPFLRGNVANATLYLANTTTRSVTAFENLGTIEERGAAWLFLRWLGAQKGDGVYGRLVQTALRGGANVESAAAEPFATLFGDFALSLYADSIPGVRRSAVPARFRMGKRTLRELLARGFNQPSYPLSVRTLAATGGTAAGTMVQGTAAYYMMTLPASGATIRFGSASGPQTPLAPALGPQVGVIRLTP